MLLLLTTSAFVDDGYSRTEHSQNVNFAAISQGTGLLKGIRLLESFAWIRPGTSGPMNLTLLSWTLSRRDAKRIFHQNMEHCWRPRTDQEMRWLRHQSAFDQKMHIIRVGENSSDVWTLRDAVILPGHPDQVQVAEAQSCERHKRCVVEVIAADIVMIFFPTREIVIAAGRFRCRDSVPRGIMRRFASLRFKFRGHTCGRATFDAA